MTATPSPVPQSVGTRVPELPPLQATRWGVGRVLLEAAFLAVIAFAALELATRLEDRIRFGTPIGSNFTDQADLIVTDRDGMHGRPNARFRKFVLNNHGFRGPDISQTPAPGTRRVFTVGASETFGLGESPGKEYPRQLEDSLEAREGLRRQLGIERFEVVNGAMLGMSLPTLTQNVRARVARFAPAVVVAYPTPVQYLMDERPVAARPDSSVVAMPEPGFRLRVLPRLVEQLKMMLPMSVLTWQRERQIAAVAEAHPPNWVFTDVPEERLRWYEEDLRAFVGTVRAIGAEPVLMGHVNIITPGVAPDRAILSAWRRFYPRAAEDVIPAFDRAARRITCRVAADSAVAYVDPEDGLTGDRSRWFTDGSHFTDEGAGLVAGLLARVIEQRLTAVAPAAPVGCITS